MPKCASDCAAVPVSTSCSRQKQCQHGGGRKAFSASRNQRTAMPMMSNNDSKRKAETAGKQSWEQGPICRQGLAFIGCYFERHDCTLSLHQAVPKVQGCSHPRTRRVSNLLVTTSRQAGMPRKAPTNHCKQLCRRQPQVLTSTES